MKKEVIEFIRTKDYKFIRDIGQGGTGKTVLLKDELIGEFFVCKKYSPFYPEHTDSYFKNFIDEIRISHLLSHRNVVRVFNYYLYPEKTTGYILMEYIKGVNISEYLKRNPENLNEIFAQTITGFKHLEECNILHRDIRPENLMVSNDGIVKIIDFGFGKEIEFGGDFNNSISINWRYSIPDDFQSKTYDFRTEVYFLAKLFEEIIQENNLNNFLYLNVLQKMIDKDMEKRIPSFFEVDRQIISQDSTEIEFSKKDKATYQRFAESLTSSFARIEKAADYIRDIDKIIMSLEEIYKNSILEDIVQNISAVTRVFVSGEYYFNKTSFLSVATLKDFLQLLKSASIDKRRLIINNLWQRLDIILRYSTPTQDDDDLPF